MTNNNATFKVTGFALLILVPILSGCSSSNTPASIRGTPSPVARQEPTLQVTPTPESTSTLVPSRIEPTPTIYYSAQEFLDWTSQIEDCEPPCIWGITPGETSVQELYEILRPFGEIVEFEHKDGSISYDFFINESFYDDDDVYIEVGYFTDDATITDMGFHANLLRPEFDTSISNLLTIWGVPSQIWVEANIAPRMSPPSYYMRLIFLDIPVMVSIHENDLIVTEIGYEICPQTIQGRTAVGPIVHFWDPALVDFNELVAPDLSGYEPLTNVNPQFDESTFWEIYKDPDSTQCIPVPISE